MSKIILSRKGYDDQYGGKPSVIMPDGTMFSFPIPINLEKEDGKESSKLTFRGKTLTDYFKELGHKDFNLVHHVDPDIYGLAGKKAMGAFGQSAGALTHLKEIDEGDIFLFFGTFCLSRKVDDKLQYEPMHPFHAIYGYLRVDKKVSIKEIDHNEEYSWLKSHPHYFNRKGDYAKNNAIFIGKDYSYFNFSSALQLTKPGYHKSYWQLPLEFQGVALSYHDKSKQRITENSVEFASVAKGQEFVFESSARLEQWLENILAHRIGPESLSVF